MRELEIDISPKQKMRLRRGEKVRVKPAMEGEGCNVLMNPETYDIVTRSFGRGKAKEIMLSLDEIEANREAVDMEGSGLFDSIKRGVSKGAKSVKKSAVKFSKSKTGKQLGKAGKKIGSEILDKGVEYSGEAGASLGTATAIALGQPELVPAFALGGKELGQRLAPLARKAIKNKTGMGIYGRGGNDGYLQRAGMEEVEANRQSMELNGRGLYASSAQRGMGLYASSAVGNGLYASSSAPRGSGLYASSAPPRGMGFRMVGNTLSNNEGQVLGKYEVGLPHLLKSDPFGSSFHQQVQLPPQYHKFHSQ
tara:strand:+ start:931 stop:1854 length:924 start_codon:yes stop_codon:yes gene_type:complete